MKLRLLVAVTDPVIWPWSNAVASSKIWPSLFLLLNTFSFNELNCICSFVSQPSFCKFIFQMTSLIIIATFSLFLSSASSRSSYLLMLYPRNNSCHISMEGTIFSIALSTETYPHNYSPKLITILLNVSCTKFLFFQITLRFQGPFFLVHIIIELCGFRAIRLHQTY